MQNISQVHFITRLTLYKHFKTESICFFHIRSIDRNRSKHTTSQSTPFPWSCCAILLSPSRIHWELIFFRCLQTHKQIRNVIDVFYFIHSLICWSFYLALIAGVSNVFFKFQPRIGWRATTIIFIPIFFPLWLSERDRNKMNIDCSTVCAVKVVWLKWQQ